MPNVPREDRVVVAMKAEATSGVDSLGGTYTAADVVPTVAGSVRFQRTATHTENRMTAGNIGRAPSIQGAALGTVTFSMYWRGRGTAYTAGNLPEADKPLLACMLTSTVATGTVKYIPAAVETTYTVYVCADVPGGLGWSVQMVGCVGSFRSTHRAGERLQADFTLQGAIDTETDITYTGGTLALSPPFPTHASSDFTIHDASVTPIDYKPCVETITFDLANQLATVPCMNAAAGIEGYYVASRVPNLRADPQLDREATTHFYDAIKNGFLKAVSFQCGTTQFNRIKYGFNATGAQAVQMLNHGLVSRGGIMALDTEFLATLQNGNDEFAITFD